MELEEVKNEYWRCLHCSKAVTETRYRSHFKTQHLGQGLAEKEDFERGIDFEIVHLTEEEAIKQGCTHLKKFKITCIICRKTLKLTGNQSGRYILTMHLQAEHPDFEGSFDDILKESKKLERKLVKCMHCQTTL